MEKNVYLIKWHGPFSSREEVEKWEKDNFACNLYLLRGMKKNAKTKNFVYCGMTKRRASKRFKDKGHRINEIEDRISEIYIGKIDNIRGVNEPKVKLVEKVLTAYLDEFLGRESLLNKINFSYPEDNVYIINEWWKAYENATWERLPSDSIAQYIPNVMCYHFVQENKEYEIFGSMRFSRLV